MPVKKPHPLTILFEDTHLIVLSKPAGMLSQGEKTGDYNLVDWLREYLGRNYVGLIHRLDRNTSGVMLVAKRTKAAQRLTESLQKGEIVRSYLAWVKGAIPQAARWRHFLAKDEKLNLTRVVQAQAPGAKEAILSIRPLIRGELETQSMTLAEFTLETGRSHQIRAQASHEGHPLIGDIKYGGPRTPLISRPALHSFHIEFPHPMGDAPMSFTAPLPEDFLAIFKRISGSIPSDSDRLLGRILARIPRQGGSET